MKTLDQAMIEAGADKASVHPVKPHDYARHYDAAFGHLRNEQIKILEIGIGSGESIRGWLSFFPNAHVYGCDIVANTNAFNTHYPSDKVNPNPSYDFLAHDQSDAVGWACYLAYSGRDFTIICDDGSHVAKDMIVTFDCLWPTLVPGGYYILEDLGVDEDTSVFFSAGYPRHLEWVRSLMHKMNKGLIDIESISFFSEVAILKKK
jgi:hypothetical protein